MPRGPEVSSLFLFLVNGFASTHLSELEISPYSYLRLLLLHLLQFLAIPIPTGILCLHTLFHSHPTALVWAPITLDLTSCSSPLTVLPQIVSPS